MSHDPTTVATSGAKPTRDVARKEVLRKLKRAISREIYRLLTNPDSAPVPDWTDLRPTRQAKNITLQTAADHFGVWPAHIRSRNFPVADPVRFPVGSE